ncbi:MAG TPA: DUF488 domain-containing protein [Ktedonobacterales bacterium]|jgi:uncharacterized protein YeaO (DUF488 family)
MSQVGNVQVKIKRVYDPPAVEDGQRVLIDRLWPRGLKREDARLDEWLRDIAPSDDLRRWFGHDPARWEAFQARYRRELADAERQAALEKLRERVRRGPLTLLFAAKDAEHCNAQVLRSLLEEEQAGAG